MLKNSIDFDLCATCLLRDIFFAVLKFYRKNFLLKTVLRIVFQSLYDAQMTDKVLTCVYKIVN